MKAGAASVLACDIDAWCGAALALNAAANAVEATFTAENLLAFPPPDVDVVLAGDVAYERPMAEAVLAWLAAAHRRGATVLIGDPGRSYFVSDGLVKLAEYHVATTRELEDAEVKRTGGWSYAD